MTDARITQGLAQIAHDVDVDGRITQALAQVAHDVDADVRITQAFLLVAVPNVVPDIRYGPQVWVV